MPYPQMSEYQIAIQNPYIVFSDHLLKNGKVETNPLGLPKVSSGGFALTYCLKNGTIKYAVRCFHRETKDLQLRYKQISNFIKSLKSDYFVDFEYIEKGITINSRNYPIVKMDWINGIPLNIYIEDNLNNKNVLVDLSEQLITISDYIEKTGFSHGDLQHGNILISKNKLVLIDYDGMYVPNMSFKESNETGHMNFQHPLRDYNCFNEKLDRFSLIAIYIAIQSLIIDSSLWKKYDNGDNILFKRNDYLNPSTSSLFNDLLSLNNLNKKIELFLKICNGSFEDIPCLYDFIEGKIRIKEFSQNQRMNSRIINKRQYPVVNGNNRHEVIKQTGNVVEIIGQITDIHSSYTRFKTPYVFLNFGNYKNKCFTVVVWSTQIKKLNQQGIDLLQYNNKWVSIIGLLGEYKSAPQIEWDQTCKLIQLKGKTEADNVFNELTQIKVDNQEKPIHFNNNNNNNINIDIDIDIDIDNNNIKLYEVEVYSDYNCTQFIEKDILPFRVTFTGRKEGDVIKEYTKSGFKFIKIIKILNSETMNNEAINNQNLKPSLITTNNTQTSNNNIKVNIDNKRILEEINKISINRASINANNYIQKTTINNQKNNQTGCFIATEIYGDYNNTNVIILRKWRDEFLLKKPLGKIFVKTYYFIAPALVKFLHRKITAKLLIKGELDKFINYLEKKGEL